MNLNKLAQASFSADRKRQIDFYEHNNGYHWRIHQ